MEPTNENITGKTRRYTFWNYTSLYVGEDYRKEKTFVIVEGDDDLKFIKNKNLMIIHMDSNCFQDGWRWRNC